MGDPADPLPIAAGKGKNLGPHLPRVGFLFLSGVRSAEGLHDRIAACSVCAPLVMRLILFSIVAFAVSALAAPIHEAASVADFKGVKSELDKGVSPDLKDGDGNSAMHLAFRSAQNWNWESWKKVITLLVENGASLKKYNDDINSSAPIFDAIFWRDKELVTILIDNGADVNMNYSNNIGRTPLSFTSLTPEITQLLINRGAKVNISTDIKWGYDVSAEGLLVWALPPLDWLIEWDAIFYDHSDIAESVSIIRKHGGRTSEEIIPRLVSLNKDLDFSFKFNTAKGFVYILESRDPRWNPSDWDEFSALRGTDELVEFREMRFVGFQQLYRVRVVKGN